MAREVRRLVDYPYVVVRLSCRFCNFAGRYRLARLAARLGPDADLEDVLDRFACGYGRPKKLRKYQSFCGVQFRDLWSYPEPPAPDLPPSAAPAKREEDAA